MLSVITPVHKHDFAILRQTALSLEAQTFRDFEWILMPNNGLLDAMLATIPWVGSQSSRPVELELRAFMAEVLDGLTFPVSIVPFSEKTTSIGAIKHFAFSQGKGDALVELDWDDLLTSDALARVALEFREGAADFVYSNAAYFTGDLQPAPRFNPEFGWRWRPFTYQGHTLDEIVSFDVTPASLLWIYFAPDHLRAWRRTFYEQLGGHNPEMPVADDHELILRTWLAGAKMVHLDHCLYLYRAENNTWLSERNAEIQQMTQRNYRRHLEPVALKWARDNDLLALDLCGGINPRAGFASVDVLPSADIRHDLNVFPWPFADGSVGVVRACDALEHLRDKHRVMTEIHRVLAPGGFLLSFTPSALGQGGCQDPTHVSGWVRNSFYYYTDAQFAQYIHNHSVRFLTHCLVEEYPTDWHKQHGILYVTFEGQALKGDGSRLPGNVKI